jgi:serine/threonine protein kinase
MPLEGQQLGHYRLLRLVGSGGMGEIYLAEDTRIARQIAIKVVRNEATAYPDVNATREAVRLFQREMKAITTLDHPHILPLFDFGEESLNGSTLTYMVMPFRQEGSLADWLRQRKGNEILAPEDVAHIVRQAADALQHVHDQQLVHQDVKLSNFLIRARKDSPDCPDLLLADFGIAKFTTATASASQSIRGTPAYMAPEQWDGQPVYATDQYALAIMAYQLLTGRLPFQGSPGRVMRQHFNTQPAPPSTLNPRIPQALDVAMLRALEKKPEDRFASVSDFARAFQQALVDSADPLSTPPVSREKGPEETLPVVDSIEETLPVSATRGLEATQTPVRPPVERIDKRASRKTTLFVGLAALIILGSSGLLYTVITNQVAINNAYATFTARTNATGAAIHATSAATTATAVAQANQNATAYAQATATTVSQANALATARTENPYPSYLPGKGTLALYDSLDGKSNDYHWDINTGCNFRQGSYHVTTQGLSICYAQNSDFGNIAFEVQITILQGGCGGMYFRSGSSILLTGYHVIICQDGFYGLLYSRGSGGTDTLAHGNSGVVHPRVIAVVANGPAISIYLNGQQIANAQAPDGAIPNGLIGLLAETTSSSGATEDVVYSNARVWTLG